MSNIKQEPKLYDYVTTHGLYHEGGLKVHVGKAGERKALCGFERPIASSLNVATDDWLTQSDPDKNLCQKCKLAALKINLEKVDED